MADAPQDVDKKEPAEQPKTSAQMTVQEKIAAARKYKDSGNEYYGKSEWRDALRQYHQALMFVKGLSSAGQMGSIAAMVSSANAPKTTDAEQNEIKEIERTVLLNMAAVHLKTGQLERVIDECTQVLATDASNEKAFFRRGQAHLRLNNMAKAKTDLEKANELIPNNKAIIADLKKIAVWEVEQEKKQKAVFQGMFQKMASDNQ